MSIILNEVVDVLREGFKSKKTLKVDLDNAKKQMNISHDMWKRTNRPTELARYELDKKNYELALQTYNNYE